MIPIKPLQRKVNTHLTWGGYAYSTRALQRDQKQPVKQAGQA